MRVLAALAGLWVPSTIRERERRLAFLSGAPQFPLLDLQNGSVRRKCTRQPQRLKGHPWTPVVLCERIQCRSQTFTLGPQDSGSMPKLENQPNKELPSCPVAPFFQLCLGKVPLQAQPPKIRKRMPWCSHGHLASETIKTLLVVWFSSSHARQKRPVV